ncbi:hypothetical protein N7495_005184 [Penicillium taxi]|uniref:uncharacterized protein n=1 Tax=Penicillium taxi TaxID=168475 RepID=UPI002544D822|nr:uncharacterized protein N7495_005184 [Penicillium taxi]KAJ5893493.1 hypothetical protein N7495_005184 [Penicillium taxi]
MERANEFDRKKGWNAKQVEPTTLFNEVATKFGGESKLASNKTIALARPEPVIYGDEQLAKNSKANKNKLRKLPKTNGFRLIQDAGQTATLISGKDGRIYMTNNSAEYDISAPWGGLQVDKNIFSYDVFGRLIWFNAARITSKKSEQSSGSLDSLLDVNSYLNMVDLGVSAAESMPKGAKAA